MDNNNVLSDTAFQYKITHFVMVEQKAYEKV
jgi:hypothetical protein